MGRGGSSGSRKLCPSYCHGANCSDAVNFAPSCREAPAALADGGVAWLSCSLAAWHQVTGLPRYYRGLVSPYERQIACVRHQPTSCCVTPDQLPPGVGNGTRSPSSNRVRIQSIIVLLQPSPTYTTETTATMTDEQRNAPETAEEEDNPRDILQEDPQCVTVQVGNWQHLQLLAPAAVLCWRKARSATSLLP